MTKVLCSVNTCEYWGQGDVCNAETILVNNNASSMEDLYNTEYAVELGIGDQNTGYQPISSSQTCCETMRPRQNI